MKRHSSKEKKKAFKNSIFVVNKLYLLVIFILIAIADGALAILSLFVYFGIYIWHKLTARLPIEVRGEFQYITKVYKRVDDYELKMDIWYPNQSSSSYPLVVFAHGGGWISGFRNQPNNISWCKYLASKGFVAASIDYRFGFKSDLGDILSDYDDALDFLRSHSEELGLDIGKILLMGLSAGGHLSLLYSSYYSYMEDKARMDGICGVVAYYAPSDSTDLLSTESKSLFAKYATVKTLKGKPDEQGEEYKYYSPIYWISRNMSPVLIVQGKEDKTVPFSSALKLVSELKEYGIEYELLVHPSGDHCFEMNSKDFQTVRILNRTINWMRGMISKK